jgi:hypothetical protein
MYPTGADMNNAQSGKAFSYPAILAAGICFGSWLLAPTPSKALEDTSQLLAGGLLGSPNQTLFTAPGVPYGILPDQIPPNKGESAVQLRMPAGQLKKLRVKLTTQNVPSSGFLTVVVRRNAVNTTLTCELTRTGECNSNAIVNIAENDKLSVRMINNFVGSGLVGMTYTLLFN